MRRWEDPGDQNVHKHKEVEHDPAQGGLFDAPAVKVVPDAHFNGDDYVDARDRPRLRGQILRVFDVMRDSEWRTLGEIEVETGDPQPSISAQLRHLRKPRFGKHTVEKRHRGDPAGGLYEYRLTPRGGPNGSDDGR